MIVFWRGHGYIALLAGLFPVLTNFALSYPQPRSTALPVGIACLLASLICFLAWRKLRTRLDSHTLYFLPLWFWALVYLGLSGWCLATAAKLL
jgi:Na+/melibiose symporter-like transporter